jgi:2-phospho-L-lactate guanylyltransferase
VTLPRWRWPGITGRVRCKKALARDYGARTVQEKGAPQLNVALTRATVVVKEYTTRGVLIVPADLPLITPQDVQTMLEYAKDPPVVVVAPDRHREGTNALLICPVGLIEYDFGPNSFQRHCELARSIGARLEIVDLPSIALDVDLPEDLDRVGEEFENYLVKPRDFKD